MYPSVKWSAQAVALRLVELVSEHGVPNGFQLHEVAGDTDRSSVLQISRIARLELIALNRCLQAENLQAAYLSRQGASSPAQIRVERSF